MRVFESVIKRGQNPFVFVYRTYVHSKLDVKTILNNQNFIKCHLLFSGFM